MLTTLGPSFYLAVSKPGRAAAPDACRTDGRDPARATARHVWHLSAGDSALFVVSALNLRFGWSSPPTWLAIVGNIVVPSGSSWPRRWCSRTTAAATIRVEENQTLTTTGLYGLVRHPMYVGALIMMAGTPLALGSLLGLTVLIPAVVVLGIRILDEEKMLTDELPGYREYRQQVRYRLVPKCVVSSGSDPAAVRLNPYWSRGTATDRARGCRPPPGSTPTSRC